MTSEDRANLQKLSARLREEQLVLLLDAARTGGLPSRSSLDRIAQLELNIAAIENTLDEPGR